MITFEYIHDLQQLSKEDLEKRIADMPEEEAKELLFGALCVMFGKYRETGEDVLRSIREDGNGAKAIQDIEKN